MSRFRDVALLLLVLVIATGLASAQPGLKVSQVNSNGSVTQTNYDSTNGGPAAKSPVVGKYWDGLAATDYYNVPPYIAAPPNPQIAVGPDDILTIVNRTIARYPNPNTLGNTLVTNPYNNPPTEKSWLDVWLGIPALANLCPSGTGSNSVCVIDNASIRYDQMQGRFVVLFTVTDVPAHRSNFVLIVSKYSQFTKCSSTVPTCPASSPLFTPPVIAPIVGGTQTGGINAANWVLYMVPINLTYANATPTVATGRTGITIGSQGVNNFVTSPFCPNGGPALPLTGPTMASCTNYYPTGARMGLDNDNIILTAPVLDQRFSPIQGTIPTSSGQLLGPYAGTRVVSIAKLVVYNGTGLSTTQPPACQADTPIDCNMVNLADDIRTGTLVGLVGVTNDPAPGAVCGGDSNSSPCIPPIFWEPDNLRGRALASFDAQVSGGATGGGCAFCTAGIVTPIDYLIGTKISDNFLAGGLSDAGSQFFIQPVVYSCPGTAIFAAPSGVSFCGSPGGGQVPDFPLLGSLLTNVATLAHVGDPAPVGQGLSATNPVANDGTSLVNKRLFVGDDRPQQVMFREGLLYVARTVKISDRFLANPLGTSSVLYDIIRTCALNGLNSCGPAFSISGVGFPNPYLAIETEWFNGQNTADPQNDVAGFGFYSPMLESPADVIASGPVSPISLFPWFEKLFVGMTTGGTSNLSATFSKNFPSLWDFRPGDDGYDTAQPYLDPYTGVVATTVACPGNIVVQGTTNGTRTITVVDATGLAPGMFVTAAPGGLSTSSITITGIAGNTITVSANVGGTTSQTGLVTFSRNSPNITVTANTVTVGLPTIAVNSLTGLMIGMGIGGGTQNRNATFDGSAVILVDNVGNIGLGETVVGRQQTYTVATVLGSNTVNLPNGSQVAAGEAVTGTAVAAGTTVLGPPDQPVSQGAGLPITVKLSANLTATNANGSLTFDSRALIPAGTTVQNVQTVIASGGPQNQVTLSAAPTVADSGPNGLSLQFGTQALFTAGTTIINLQTIGGVNFVTLSTNALTTTSNVAIMFNVTGISTTTCPMIPWSSRGGASTDPNDGSLWLYGEFAKNRLSTIPGPGIWGTSVANYALDFPAADLYNNDNSFFADVQPGSAFFTWIQIAKNVGIAVAAGSGTCPANPPGNNPIQQPPAPGTTPTPGTSTLVCPNFGPLTVVTRSEMARWVVLAQMDETMVTNYLRATGGDPATDPSHLSSFSDTIADPNLRYIEVMYRRGYTKGCSTTGDALRRYCPTDPITRGQMAVFLIRAKMNNVFPTTLSGIPLTAPYGDNFGLFQQATPYFNDIPTTDDFYKYIQKMRELRITNGQTLTTYGSTTPLTRQEIATFIVRAFFL